MGIKKIRKDCIFCKNELVDILKIPRMPVFMGAVKNVENLRSDMTFCKCIKCNSIQIRELIDPIILYKNNHNIGTIGETWNNHYKEFSRFIKDSIIDKRILEIADPSCKIAKDLSNLTREWVIVEINISEKEIPEKVRFINKWFDKNFDDGKFDVVIHSHFLEHAIDPISIISKTNQCLEIGGKTLFSVPNLEYLAKNNYMPSNILHFEHTYFFTTNDMVNLMNKCGFECNRIIKYKNHSIFYECTKIKDYQHGKSSIVFEDFEKNFIIPDNILNSIEEFNKIKENKYIFGCHISTQSLLSLGLNLEGISFILDNSEEKEDNYLYGTELKTKRPDIIKYINTPSIFVSHSSVYKEEISNQLKSINQKVKLI